MIARPHDRAGAPAVKHAAAELAEHGPLAVDASECAVFARDGQVFGIVGPGHHTLSGHALPFLNALRGGMPGVFTSSVFFVTTHPIGDVKFGGPLHGLRGGLAFGSLTVRIADPGLFVTSIGEVSSEELGRLFSSKLLTLVDGCAAEWIRAGHFTQETIGQAGAAMAQTLAPHLTFLREHGLELVRFDNLGLKVR